jgi:heterodisulfide reductase subunit B
MIPIKYPQMELATRVAMKQLGITLVDVDGFSCCPDPIYFKAKDKMAWLTMAARNLAVAEQEGLNVITLCSGCTSTLIEAQYLLKEDPAVLEDINRRLQRVGREYLGKIEVKHIATFLRDDVGIEKVKASVTRPLSGLKVGIHYGCHLLKPSQIMAIDDADYPQILEVLVEALGATPVGHDEKHLCCGKGCLDDELPLDMTYSIFESMARAGVDCMGLICPTCFSSFDLGQILLARQRGVTFDIPIIYLCQLMGLAQGYTPEEVGLHLHRVGIDRLMDKLNQIEETTAESEGVSLQAGSTRETNGG